MYKPPSSKSPSTFSSAVQIQRSAVGEMIRRAERSIVGQDYKMAQNLLAEAWRLDPGNPYIPAIVERVQILQGMASEFAAQLNGPGTQFPSVTVGKEFPGGFKPAESAGMSSGKIQRLLTVATTLLERGSYPSAFETILKAEELDPQDPDVQSLKAKVLPLYEASMTRRSAGTSAPTRRGDSAGVAASMAGRLMAEALKEQQASALQPENVLPTFEDRLEELRRQKETERLASERALWSQTTQKRTSTRQPSPPAQPQKSSFISTLLRGKNPG
jgi:hypothetical protein